MELVVTDRELGKNSLLKKCRQQGGIPAVIYSKGNSGSTVATDAAVFNKFLSKIEPGSLASTVFSLNWNGTTKKAIIKGIQYHVTTYAVLHIDFEELHEDSLVTLNIPIKCINALECAGVKLGGVLRQVMNHLKVRCLPKDIIPSLELDVKALCAGQTKRLSDVVIPAGLTPLIAMKEVVVTITRR